MTFSSEQVSVTDNQISNTAFHTHTHTYTPLQGHVGSQLMNTDTVHLAAHRCVFPQSQIWYLKPKTSSFWVNEDWNSWSDIISQVLKGYDAVNCVERTEVNSSNEHRGKTVYNIRCFLLSGLQLGQFSTWTLLLQKHAVVLRAKCGLSWSLWNLYPLFLDHVYT